MLEASLERVVGRARSKQPAYDHVPQYLLYAFCVYVVTWYTQLSGRIALLEAIRFEFVLAAMLIVLSLAVQRQSVDAKSELRPYIGWFFLVLVVQIPFSHNVDYSWSMFVDRVIKFAFMAVFIATFVRSPVGLRLFIAAFMIAWLKLGQEGIFGQITGSLVWENQGVMRLHGSTPLYLHPNSFSGFALGTLPFIFYLLPIANRWQKLALLLLLVFALNIVLFTGSRTGYVGFVFLCAYMFWRSKRKFRFVAGAVICAMVALPFIPEQYVGRFNSIAGQEVEGQSKERRIEILQDAVVIFSEHPFGVGIAAFPTVRQQRFGRFQDTHNLYMEVLTNLGVQGFVVWGLLLVALFRSIGRLVRELDSQLTALGPRGPPAPRSPVARHIADLRLMRAMLQAVGAYVAVRLVLGLFGMDLYEIYWWFALGTVIAIHNMTQVAGRISRRYLSHDAVIVPTASSETSG